MMQIIVQSQITNSSGETDEMTLYTEATCRKDLRKTYVMYEETEISGMENMKTLLIYDGEQVQIKRFGQTDSVLTIKVDEVIENQYHTPYGMFIMSTRGRSIKWHFEQELDIELRYSLDIQGERSEVKIKIESKRNENVEEVRSEQGTKQS